MKGRKAMKRIGMLALLVALLTAAIPATALAASYLEATGGRVRVRSGPGVNYSSLYTLVEGETVSYTGSYSYDSNGTKWYKVQYSDYGTGWVSEKYSVVYSDGSSGVYLSYVQAEGGSANIRQSPKLTGTSLEVIHDGEYAAYLGQTSTDNRGVDWYYVNYDGTVGWVSSRYCTLYSGERYVQAEGGNVNVRQTPELTGKNLDTMYDGEYATYLNQTSTDRRGVLWYYVDYDGAVGWVSSRYASLI